MPSRLLQLANSLTRAARGASAARAGGRRAERLAEQLLRSTSGTYSPAAARNMTDLLSHLGPLGEAIRAAIGAGRRGSLGVRQLEAAMEILGITKDLGRPIEIPVAEEVLERLEETVRRPPPLPKRPPPLPGGRKGPPPLPPGTAGGFEDDEPPEHDIRLSGRGSMGFDQQGMEELVGREIRTPGSSNVYSFVFEPENRQQGITGQGILYVTFKAWHPGQKGERPNRAGPTYAYYDVPVRKYKAFESMAASTAGGAVWDYLRVRGSKHDHRHPYRLVAGSLVPAGGEYVPRKATRRGFRKRAIPAMGTGKRGFVESSLPEMVSRGAPNRGAPNRGRPDRGR
jgi:hypothetical protein